MESIGRILLMPQGTYDATKTYVPLDYVRYGTKVFVCKKQCLGQTPVDGEYWQMLVQDGQDGTGVGDMKKSVYDTNDNGIVDKAETVGNASTTVLEKLTDTDGKLYYDGTQVGKDVNVDGTTITKTNDTLSAVSVDTLSESTLPVQSKTVKTSIDTLSGRVTTNEGDISTIEGNITTINTKIGTDSIGSDSITKNISDIKTNLTSGEIPFKFGVDTDGNYGYYKAGADTVTPFKTGGLSVSPNYLVYSISKWLNNNHDFYLKYDADGGYMAKRFSYAGSSISGSGIDGTSGMKINSKSSLISSEYYPNTVWYFDEMIDVTGMLTFKIKFSVACQTYFGMFMAKTKDFEDLRTGRITSYRYSATQSGTYYEIAIPTSMREGRWYVGVSVYASNITSTCTATISELIMSNF